jgi:moderate conductance mechanosensitive channel
MAETPGAWLRAPVPVQFAAVPQDYYNRAWELALRAQGPAMKIAVIVIGSFVAYRVVRLFTTQFRRLAAGEAESIPRAQRQQRLETLGAILDNLARVVLIGLVVVMSLEAVEIQVTPLIAGAGIAGLAIGFGAQSLVKDFFSGFFIIFENQFSIGDEVVIAGHTGTVERMTLRTTTLRDTGGSIHIVPNGKIESVTIVAREWARVAVDVTVPYGEDLAKALDVVARAAASYAEQHPDTLLDDAPTIGVQDLGPRGATIRLAVKTAQGRHLGAARDLRRAVVLALYEAQVRLAHPREE